MPKDLVIRRFNKRGKKLLVTTLRGVCDVYDFRVLQLFFSWIYGFHLVNASCYQTSKLHDYEDAQLISHILLHFLGGNEPKE